MGQCPIVSSLLAECRRELLRRMRRGEEILVSTNSDFKFFTCILFQSVTLADLESADSNLCPRIVLNGGTWTRRDGLAESKQLSSLMVSFLLLKVLIHSLGVYWQLRQPVSTGWMDHCLSHYLVTQGSRGSR